MERRAPNAGLDLLRFPVALIVRYPFYWVDPMGRSSLNSSWNFPTCGNGVLSSSLTMQIADLRRDCRESELLNWSRRYPSQISILLGASHCVSASYLALT